MPGETYTVQPLMSALSNVLGQVVELDTEGECGLEFEGDVDLTIACRGGPEPLTVRCALTGPMDELPPHALRAMLMVNYGHLPSGHMIALDEETGRLVLLAMLPPAIDPQEFIAVLAGFVALVPELRAQLQAPSAPIQPLPMPFMGAWA